MGDHWPPVASKVAGTGLLLVLLGSADAPTWLVIVVCLLLVVYVAAMPLRRKAPPQPAEELGLAMAFTIIEGYRIGLVDYGDTCHLTVERDGMSWLEKIRGEEHDGVRMRAALRFHEVVGELSLGRSPADVLHVQPAARLAAPSAPIVRPDHPIFLVIDDKTETRTALADWRDGLTRTALADWRDGLTRTALADWRDGLIDDGTLVRWLVARADAVVPSPPQYVLYTRSVARLRWWYDEGVLTAAEYDRLEAALVRQYGARDAGR